MVSNYDENVIYYKYFHFKVVSFQILVFYCSLLKNTHGIVYYEQWKLRDIFLITCLLEINLGSRCGGMEDPYAVTYVLCFVMYEPPSVIAKLIAYLGMEGACLYK